MFYSWLYKFCVWGGEKTNFSFYMTNINYFYLLYVKSDFKVICTVLLKLYKNYLKTISYE